ncbi:MAG TPA: glutamyl-tRNA reductase [Chitinophagales bacterium]|nr:glutamyl-tRNA reductase [Chitinophagales bacterium]HMX04328.1 glutamyl-tRNA reductase [Chitinophagales bacterium]HNA57976.1 glutamyl-tRNA reductase [Chitinophagales bacterium]HNE45893.1 glutamyl-tRNA reductase [Chitinophagales bacterium]HNF68501.1 glutamyl-tRNA reductase [Chitinophagales bacterium]
MNQYKVLTVTHKQVPLGQLSNYIVPFDKQTTNYSQQLQSIKQEMKLDELMYLNTCNRVTYFFTTTQPVDNQFTAGFFKTVNPEFEACNVMHSQLFEGVEAIEHMCEVSASLDSLVVGEREIIRQLRVAYEESNEMALTGDDIRLAMKMLIPAAKKIYTETHIAEKPVSVVSLAALRLRELEIPQHAAIILIGAGETITNMSAYLADMGFQNFSVFNRTLANAEKLVSSIGGKAYQLDALKTFTGGFDVIISCTGSVEPVINEEIYQQLIGRDTQKKVIIDLAIPQDIDTTILSRNQIDYIHIDDLRSIAQKNLSLRKAEVVKAKKLVHEFVKEFQAAYIERLVEKAHSAIPQKLHEIRLRAVEEVYAKDVASLDPHAKEVMDKLLDYMEKKYLALTMASSKSNLRHPH